MNRILLIVITFLLLILGYASVFVVNEGQNALLLRFQKVTKGDDGQALVYEPGLHFKVPLIDSVSLLDARLQNLKSDQQRFVVDQQKELLVDAYVKWRIKDFETFYNNNQRGNFALAESRLQPKVYNGLRDEFGSRSIADIVSGSRSELMAQALAQVKEAAIPLGIEVVDVRVKMINLPPKVSNAIFEQMRAERLGHANLSRATGKKEAEDMRANADARVTVELAKAEQQSRTIRGEGDAIAAKIYAKAYAQDPEFFSFLRSLEAYKKSFSSKDDVMVLKPDSDFFRYMKGAEKQK
ncbi:protease modulator HflC [Gallaecimonas xiamenensis]|uniref:Protein HflC n=1 Tax=Gallaecimonas xiamenensis 3-C-1 TaxID=745411 RepID=K2ID05_9GAMM|nr:protease modulator HflC [Gallaecimonas xiamenensis]EKE67856.1 HflC protein [Gallaecimonas xiamenensis 3-C-1]